MAAGNDDIRRSRSRSPHAQDEDDTLVEAAAPWMHGEDHQLAAEGSHVLRTLAISSHSMRAAAAGVDACRRALQTQRLIYDCPICDREDFVFLVLSRSLLPIPICLYVSAPLPPLLLFSLYSPPPLTSLPVLPRT